MGASESTQALRSTCTPIHDALQVCFNPASVVAVLTSDFVQGRPYKFDDTQQQRSGELLPIFSETTEEARDAPLRATYDIEGLDGRELTTIAVARTGASA